MALRKASAYTQRYARPYTRKSNVKSKSYIKTIPPNKLVKLQMGDIKGFEQGKFKIILRFSSAENVQIRDNAIEAARQYVHKELEDNFLGQYYFAVKVFPHHILRENRMLTGAGADRMQTGMAHSFGTNIGRAAMVKENQEVFVLGLNSAKAAGFARSALEKVRAKLPCRMRILTEIRK